MNETDTTTSITVYASREVLDTMEGGAGLRKKYQMSLPAIHVELSDIYDEGWAHTETNSYYFDHSTDMIEFVKMVLNDIEEGF